MDDSTIIAICTTVLGFLIALLNELMPSSTVVYIRGLTIKGEKGVITTALVWLGIMKSAAEKEAEAEAEKEADQKDPVTS